MSGSCKVSVLDKLKGCPLKILHFTPASSFDRKFLFHPLLNECKQGVRFFAVGKTGFKSYTPTQGGVIRAYLRAFILLLKGFGAINKSTVAYCHTTRYALPGLVLCRLFGVGQVIYFNHGVPYIGYSGFLRLALLLLEKANMAVAHRFITVSPAMVPFLQPALTSEPWRNSTSPGSSSGLHASDFVTPHKVREKARAVSQRGTRYMFAGRLQSRKGVFVLLEAWRAHVKRFPSDELWLCGFEAKELALHGDYVDLPRLKINGYVKNMESVYSEVDVVVSPSFHEGFGYTLLEGGARGCCMLSSSVPGPDVMFTKWMHQQLFIAGDSGNLGVAMARLSGSTRALAVGRLLSYRSACRFVTHKVTYPNMDGEHIGK